MGPSAQRARRRIAVSAAGATMIITAGPLAGGFLGTSSASADTPSSCAADGLTMQSAASGTTATLIPPANITAVHVVASGGQGADGTGTTSPARNASGGAGATVTTDVPVTPQVGLTLSAGQQGNLATGGSSGGIPSGGDGSEYDAGAIGGGGGGASSLTAAGSPVVVAAGGGGGGHSAAANDSTESHGGSAAAASGSYPAGAVAPGGSGGDSGDGSASGGAGATSQPGGGGTGTAANGDPGLAGDGGMGGVGSTSGGAGGGGGGYAGGGGGGDGTYAAGGGAGSSYSTGAYSLSSNAGDGSITVSYECPSFTSTGPATFPIQSSTTYTITTDAVPAATITESGALPGGLSFTDNGDGTATISGTPAAGYGGMTDQIQLSADNGDGTAATQTLDVHVTPYTPTVTVSVNHSTIRLGETAHLRATVSSFSAVDGPTGEFTFMDNGTDIPKCAVILGTGPSTGRSAKCSTSSLPLGKDKISAHWDPTGGNVDYIPASSTSNPTVTVEKSSDRPRIKARVTSSTPRTRYGWYRSPVTITFSCSTSGSALVGSCPRPVTLRRSAGGQKVSRTITARDGAAATATVGPINIDRVAPKLRAVGAPHSSKPYDGPAPKVRCMASDALSGIANCHVVETTSDTGRTRYRAVATDKAGNISTVSGGFRSLREFVEGAAINSGRFVTHRGSAYTFGVYAGSQPRYYDAQPAGVRGGTPFKRGPLLNRDGQHLWTVTINITQRMRKFRYWNIGALVGSHLRVVKLDVVP